MLQRRRDAARAKRISPWLLLQGTRQKNEHSSSNLPFSLSLSSHLISSRSCRLLLGLGALAEAVLGAAREVLEVAHAARARGLAARGLEGPVVCFFCF